ncbi:MAG: hypothetical protein JSW54_04085 [Fidelibacterota bacterium]|nr:MAG: hypothetical protein JSW54_04085 [Candidatus Neomarinimicrobiota bacterium]
MKETTPPGKPNPLTKLFDRFFAGRYRQLDWLFLLRPVLLIPVWTMTAAGFGAGSWLSSPDLFWHVAWNWTVLLVFIGITLIVGAAFIQVQLQQNGEAEIKGHPNLLAESHIDPEKARRLAWICLGLGVLLLLPGGWVAVIAGIAIYAIWGLLYGSNTAIWRNRPAIDILIHLLAGAVLFYVGWGTSGAPLSGSLNVAAPYVLGFAGITALIAITPGPRFPEDSPRPGKTAITNASSFAAVLAIAATIWGYSNGDPIISTTAVLTLPFHAVGLYFRREIDMLRTSRYAILIFVIFAGTRYPLLYIPIILDFYLSRYYYRRRFGFPHPCFHAPDIEWTGV